MSRLWPATILMVLAACDASSPAQTSDGGSQAVKPFTEAEMRAAMTALNTKVCDATERCDPTRFLKLYGTREFCITGRHPPPILRGFFGHGSRLTPENLHACAAALDLSTCRAYTRYSYENVVPAACLFDGTLPDGSPCGINQQCASGNCPRPTGENGDFPNQCGRCTPKQPVGARCQLACVAGAVCTGQPPMQTCVRYADVDEHCDENTPCHPELSCAAGSCKAPPADGSCDPAAGLQACPAMPAYHTCNPTTLRCEPFPFVDDGQPCGVTSLCRFDSTCTRVATDAGTSFVCRPMLDEGSICVPLDHPFDAVCRVSRCYQNRCQRNAAAECTPPAVPP